MKTIVLGDNAAVLPTLPAGFARLAYVDPPFNTGRAQKRQRMAVAQAPGAPNGPGARTGFRGRRYASTTTASAAYRDRFDDYEAFLIPRIAASLRCLTPDASIFVHLDCRESHYVKVALDKLIGRGHFMNEIIWAYDYGGRSKTRWPAKHDTILWYALDPARAVFNYDAIDRIPYMAPGLVGPEKAARGKTPTDVWWHTIVPTGGREKTGYPTQKPLGIVERLVRVHSHPGDVVLDFFAGSGTTGEAAARNGRGFALVDESPDAVAIAAKRLARYEPDCVTFAPETGSKPVTKSKPAVKTKAVKATKAAPSPDVDPRFAPVLEALASRPGVTTGTMMACVGLKVGGKIFAMYPKGEFVAKLPKPRVDELVADGRAKRFESGAGRPMKEWVALREHAETWVELAREAYAFVKAGGA